MIKYCLIIISIIAVCSFSFVKTLPKSTALVKEEFMEDVLKVRTNAVKTISKDTLKVKTNITKDTLSQKNDNNIVAIPIEVNDYETRIEANANGVKMKFTLDTGAYDLQITSAEYYYMKHLGLVSEDDMSNEKTTYVYADNRKSDCYTINIKSLNVGGIEIKNVKAAIQENCEAECLLGQGVLKQLGTITIDYKGKKLIVKKNNSQIKNC